MARSFLKFMSAALACNAFLASHGTALPGSHEITGDVVSDNEYAIFTSNSESPGMSVSFTGFTDCWYGVIPVSFNTTDRFLYIACWSDNGVAQGLLHDIHVDGVPAFSDDPRWQVTYTGIDFSSCLGGPPAALITAMEATIPAPAGGWVSPAIGCANPAMGGSPCYGAWGHVPPIDVGVRWTWYDSGNQTSANAPFQPGFNHGEFLIFRLDMGEGAGTPICFGDGSGTACPCLNTGGPGAGCANGTGGGGVLTASGVASVSNDTMSLTADGVINNLGVFFQGNNTIGGGTGTQFGDGIRCCGGSVVKIEVANPPGTTSPATAQMSETATTNGPNGTITAGTKKCYQYWYRDPATSPCGSQFNLTNAITVTWQP